jgi:hypothetical protein
MSYRRGQSPIFNRISHNIVMTVPLVSFLSGQSVLILSCAARIKSDECGLIRELIFRCFSR